MTGFPNRFLTGFPWLGSTLAALATVGLAPTALAQVTNQSDVTGASPDIIYPSVVEFAGLAATHPELVQAAADLADRIGETHEACMALFDETAPPVARSAPATSCEELETLLEQAQALLSQADALTEEQVEQIRNQEIW